MKFVDVKNDVAFHKIFGNANKTEVLISFLNAALLLEGKAKVVEVHIENPYIYPAAHGGKTIVIDIRATDQEGRHFIVEMQVADREGFEKRTQFYTSRDYSSQIDSGEKYKFLRPTYFIGILDFVFDDEDPDYYTHHLTSNNKTGRSLLKDIQYFFIELPKFEKTLSELETMIDRWTFFIKNAETLDFIPDDVIDEGLKVAYQEADRHRWNNTELNAYYDAGAREADEEQGRIKAEQKGKIEGKMETARKMKKKGFDNNLISELTSLSIDEIESL